jgi:hypothetical protein
LLLIVVLAVPCCLLLLLVLPLFCLPARHIALWYCAL